MSVQMTSHNAQSISNKEFRILVVEDNEALSLLMQKKLMQSGDTIILANTGSKGLSILKNEKVDLVFLDYKLPDMNAIDLVKTLQEKNINIPFVIVTGVGDERTAVEIMKLGARDYIVKDTNLLDFLPSVAARIKEELLTYERLSFTENALLESEQRYRLLVENIDLGIILINTENQIVTANAAIGRMLEKPVQEMINKDIFQAIPFHYDTVDIKSLKKMLISDTPVDNEAEIRVSAKKILKIRIRAFPYLGPRGSLNGYIEVFEDITEQKYLEEQLIQAQKMEAVGLMAGGIAHDFNNLLTTMQGHSELALMDLSPKTTLYEELMGIIRSVKLGSELTNQLLLFSRKQPLKLKILDINQVIQNMLNMLNRIMDKSIILDVKLSGETCQIKADAGNIEQVILNLAINAQDAMPDGGILTLKTALTELGETECKKFTNATPGSYLHLSLKDTGSGLSPDILKHIFEPFFTTKAVGKGTGLGLSIVYSIVNKHNGFIDVESYPGSGTTFHIYFKALV